MVAQMQDRVSMSDSTYEELSKLGLEYSKTADGQIVTPEMIRNTDAEFFRRIKELIDQFESVSVLLPMKGSIYATYCLAKVLRVFKDAEGMDVSKVQFVFTEKSDEPVLESEFRGLPDQTYTYMHHELSDTPSGEYLLSIDDILDSGRAALLMAIATFRRGNHSKLNLAPMTVKTGVAERAEADSLGYYNVVDGELGPDAIIYFAHEWINGSKGMDITIRKCLSSELIEELDSQSNLELVELIEDIEILERVLERPLSRKVFDRPIFSSIDQLRTYYKYLISNSVLGVTEAEVRSHELFNLYQRINRATSNQEKFAVMKEFVNAELGMSA